MKKFMRVLTIILALLLAFALFACDAAPNMDGAINEGGNLLDGIIGGTNNSQSGISGDQSSIGGTPSDPDEGWDDEVVAPDASTPPQQEGDAEVEGGENEPSPGGTEGGVAESPTEVETWESTEDETSAPPAGDTEPLSSLITTPFISTAESPFSTFSADVDTASYTYFRKLMGYGYTLSELRNTASNFRTEEFINYFRYEAKAPADGELFGVTTSLVPCPWNEETLLFRATLQTETPVVEAPNNLVFLIDVSGSMSSSDKLPLLKKAFSYLVGSLKPNDTVSIVTYSGREAVVLDGCKGNNPDEIMNAINSLVAGGSTNGEAGLTMAYQIAEKHMSEGSNNRIIMASDGDLNVGISSADQLTQYIEQKRNAGIYLSVLGFGTGNYRDDKMEALADNGNGVYYYIDGVSEAEKVFGTDLTGTLYTVANDVKLQIEFNSQRVESYRLIGYDNRILDKEDFENDAKDAGDVGAGHQVTVCYEIKLAEVSEEEIIDAPLLTLRVRYKNPGEPLSLLNEYMVSGFVYEPNDDMRFIASVIELVSLIRNSGYDGDITVSSIFDELQGLDLTDPMKIEFRELVKALIEK